MTLKCPDTRKGNDIHKNHPLYAQADVFSGTGDLNFFLSFLYMHNVRIKSSKETVRSLLVLARKENLSNLKL